MKLKPRMISGLRVGARTFAPIRRSVNASLSLFLLSCGFLSAQNVVLTGGVSGRVTDTSGAVVAGVSVVVGNLATGVRQTTVTNQFGLYRFPSLMPGTYSVTASIKGFADVEALVRVLVGNTTAQDFHLRAGAGAETVRVDATTSPLRPTESSSSTVLDRALIDELPLSGE